MRPAPALGAERVKPGSSAVDNRTPRPQRGRPRAPASDRCRTLFGMSFLIPDTDAMYAVADRITGHAAAARQRGGALGAALAAVDWHGLAADAFDAMSHGVLVGLRSAADRLDDAAAALRK